MRPGKGGDGRQGKARQGRQGTERTSFEYPKRSLPYPVCTFRTFFFFFFFWCFSFNRGSLLHVRVQVPAYKSLRKVKVRVEEGATVWTPRSRSSRKVRYLPYPTYLGSGSPGKAGKVGEGPKSREGPGPGPSCSPRCLPAFLHPVPSTTFTDSHHQCNSRGEMCSRSRQQNQKHHRILPLALLYLKVGPASAPASAHAASTCRLGQLELRVPTLHCTHYTTR